MSMMARASWLTVRIHRFEIVAVVVLLAVVGAAAAYFGQRIDAAVPAGCEGLADRTCGDDTLDFFWKRVAEAEWLMTGTAGLVPVIAGLLLGAPVVAREIETGTASLAWSLSLSRRHWLLSRSLPQLLLLLVGLSIVGILATGLHEVRFRDRLELESIGLQGPAYVARGLAAFGLALLFGAITGRTMSSFVLSGALAVGLVVAAMFATPAAAREMAVWVDTRYDEEREAWREPRKHLFRIGLRYRDVEGRRIGYQRLRRLRDRPDEARWLAQNVIRSERIVTYRAYRMAERIETAGGFVIWSACVLLAFPLVHRRRPG